MDWDGDIAAGQVLDVPYLMHFSSPSEINGIILLGVQLCGNNGDEYVIILLQITILHKLLLILLMCLVLLTFFYHPYLMILWHEILICT